MLHAPEMFQIHGFPIKFKIHVMLKGTNIYLRTVSDSYLFTRNFPVFFT